MRKARAWFVRDHLPLAGPVRTKRDALAIAQQLVGDTRPRVHLRRGGHGLYVYDEPHDRRALSWRRFLILTHAAVVRYDYDRQLAFEFTPAPVSIAEAESPC